MKQSFYEKYIFGTKMEHLEQYGTYFGTKKRRFLYEKRRFLYFVPMFHFFYII